MEFGFPGPMSRLFRNSKLTIKQKLRQEGFIPITGDDEEWVELAEAYALQNYRPKWIRVNGLNSCQEIAYRLKQRAVEVLKEEYKSEQQRTYILASKWCTVAKTIRERAEHMGFTFLNMEVEDHVDDEIWEMRILDYRPWDEEINMTEQLARGGDMPKKISIIKKIAKDMVEKKQYEESSEQMWNTSIRWFTKERP